MKKIVCLVLALMMLLAGSALAESEKEITFQGVPWGSSADDAYQRLLEKGLFSKEFDELSSTSRITHRSLTSKTNDNVYLTSENGGEVVTIAEDYFPIIAFLTNESVPKTSTSMPETVTLIREDAKIAGYQVDDLSLYYAYNENNTELLSVVVTLKVDDLEEACSDLSAKLTTLYGKSSQIKEQRDTLFGYGRYASTNIVTTHNAWMGANNTAVVLKKNKAFTGVDSITLIYGTLDAQEILDAYYAEYQENYVPEPTVNPFDLSGL